MRTPIKFAIAAFTLCTAACAPAAKTASASDDFKRDLQLASATNMDLAAPAVNSVLLTSLETAVGGAPKPAKTIKKDLEGPMASPSEAPTVEAAPEPVPAPVEEAQPVAQAPAPAAVPVETNEPVAVAPHPQPAPVIPSGGAGAGDYGTGGGVFGGGTGSVIRGGGVDGDHCDPHGRRGGGIGIIFRSPVYTPRMGGSAPPRVVVVSPRGR